MSTRINLSGPGPDDFVPAVTAGLLGYYLFGNTPLESFINYAHDGVAPVQVGTFESAHFSEGSVEFKSATRYLDTRIPDQNIEVFGVFQTDETALGTSATRPSFFGTLAAPAASASLSTGGKWLGNGSSSPYGLMQSGIQNNSGSVQRTTQIVTAPPSPYGWSNFALVDALWSDTVQSVADLTKGKSVSTALSVPQVSSARTILIGSDYYTYAGRNKWALAAIYQAGVTTEQRAAIIAQIRSTVSDRLGVIV